MIVPSDWLLLHHWSSCNSRLSPSNYAIDVVVVVVGNMRVVVDRVSLRTGNRRATVETRFDGMIFNGVVQIQLPSLLLLWSHCRPAPVVVVAPGDVGMDVVVGGPRVVVGLVLLHIAVASAGD